MTGYKIIIASTVKDLAEKVSKIEEEGWEAKDAPWVDSLGFCRVYKQEMVLL